MAKKCKIITLGRVNKRIFIILIGGVFYTGILFVEQESIIFDKGNNVHPIIYSIMNSLSLCLSFIPLIIYYYKTRRKNKDILAFRQYSLGERESFHNLKPISRTEKFLWILLASVIDFFCVLFSSIFWVTNDSYLSTLQINIIPMAIFSYLILKMKLYKHHYLCIIAVIIKSIIFSIIFGTFSNIQSFTKEILPLIVTFITDVVSCLTFVMYKYFMTIKYINPYKIMFFRGLIESPLSIITLVITSYKFKHIDDFSVFKEKANIKEILILIAWIIIYFLYMLIFFKTIEIFNPFYLYFSIILSEYIVFFISIENFEIWQIICTIFLMLLCSFMILVFVEIIELNFCGLSKMTKDSIELRARFDSMVSEDNDINDIKDINNCCDDDETYIDLKDYTFDVDQTKEKKANSDNKVENN